jgi:DNA-directed RNA polymerase subunit N (RpoN/RPB10)
MIIPVRCMTCGKLLADKYEYYERELLRKKLALNSDSDPLIININAKDILLNYPPFTN